MPEREFRQWVAYASKRLLPTRRLEAYLAQVASVVAQCAGNKDITLPDFLLEFKVKAPTMNAEAGAHVIANFAKTGVRKLGQGRKK